MTDEERDSLLARLDERTNNIYHLAETTESHLRELNGTVRKNTGDILAISDDMYGKDNKSGLCAEMDKAKANIQRIIIILVAIGGTGVLGTGIYELIKNLAS